MKIRVWWCTPVIPVLAEETGGSGRLPGQPVHQVSELAPGLVKGPVSKYGVESEDKDT